jgi:type IV secretory pathway VirB10-like protein
MKKQWTVLALAAAMGWLAGCGNNGSSQPNGNNLTNQQSSTPDNSPSAQNSTPAPAAAPTPAPPPPEPPKPYVLAAGTSIPVVLSQALNSRVNSSGDEFEGSVATDVTADNGDIAIPKGSSVSGTVVNAKKQGAIKGEADLSIRLTKVQVRGKGYLIATSTYAATQKGKGKRSAVVTGGGAALGALIGGLAGGGKGAAIGAGVGGGGGLAASAGTGGQNVDLPAESRVTFKLTDSVTIDHP